MDGAATSVPAFFPSELDHRRGTGCRTCASSRLRHWDGMPRVKADQTN
jgi:hypothetical protein